MDSFQTLEDQPNVSAATASIGAFIATVTVHTVSITLPSGHTEAASPWEIWQLHALSNLSSIAIGLVIRIMSGAVGTIIASEPRPHRGTFEKTKRRVREEVQAVNAAMALWAYRQMRAVGAEGHSKSRE